MPSTHRLAILLLVLMGAVYLFGLARTGPIEPDEPRYAAIGQAMAASGDWVTPRLWGSPWFEKPPLVYWMTAVATAAGAGKETAPRLPMALLGFGFLIVFYRFVSRNFTPETALYSTAILGTSAGWAAYSYVAVMDVPLAAFFAAALLLSLDWLKDNGGSVRRALLVGALLGMAVLAKGLVPLVLFAPALWLMRRQFPHVLATGAACLAVAGPWYILCTLRNGTPFLAEFFWKHHFERFSTGSLQHVRPFWFYIPAMAGALFPWTPLAALIRTRLWEDRRLRFLGIWLAYSFLFFSAAKNKLPGYLIPLLPAASLILGAALESVPRIRFAIFVCALLLVAIPVAAGILPAALDVGLSHATWRGFNPLWAGLFALAAFIPLWRSLRDQRTHAVAATAVLATLSLLFLKTTALPATDYVRPFYGQAPAGFQNACFENVDRRARYAIQYYADREIPYCAAGDGRRHILQNRSGLAWRE